MPTVIIRGEGHILNEELLHPLGTSLDILRQDVGDVEDSNQDDHEGEGVDGEAKVQMVVDDGNMLGIEVGNVIADNAEGQTRGVIGHSGLVFFGSGSLCIFHALHELPVAGERGMSIAQLIEQCTHDDGHEVSDADDGEGRRIPGGSIAAGGSRPHLAHGLDACAVAAAHDGDGIAGDGLDGAHAGHSAHNTGQRQRADDTGKDGGNITHKGFEKHFTVHREHRAGNQDQNVQVQKTSSAVEGVQGFLGALTDEIEGIEGTGHKAGEEHAAAEPDLPDGDVIAHPAQQGADDHSEGQCTDHVGQHPVVGRHHHHQSRQNQEHPKGKTKDLGFF